MRRSIIFGLIFTFTLTIAGCKKSNSNKANDTIDTNDIASDFKEKDDSNKMKVADFITDDFALFEEITGDLNNDGLKDVVLIIKGTDKEKILIEENSINLNRNRRGIIILIKNEKGYELVLKNYDCFSSESEEGSAYFDPELTGNLNNGNLEIGFGHGKHGFWNYIFQLKNKDFELIKYGVTATNGKVIKTETTIDYLTKIKSVKTNSNKKNDIGEDIFKEKKEKIVVKKIVKLSEIKDFDELNIFDYID